VPSQAEATQLLLERINSRALAEGRAMSQQERRLLSEGPDSDGPPDDYEPDWHFFDEMAGLLRRSYEKEPDAEARRVFVQACRTVAAGDNNLSWLVRTAGLSSPARTRLLPFRRPGLFVLLAIPGVGALLTAVGLFWGAVVGRRIAPDMRSTMVVMGAVLGGFGLHLLGVWRKDRRF
jgi:hypothetical protein